MEFTIQVNEKVINIGLNRSHDRFRDEYRDQMVDIISKSYAGIGGYSGQLSGSSRERDAISHDINTCLIKLIAVMEK